MAGGSGGREGGLVDGRGGVDEQEGGWDRAREGRQSERGDRRGLGFCVTKWQSGQISFYPQCTDSKECFLLFCLFVFFCVFFFSPLFFSLLSLWWSITVASQRPVFATQRGQFLWDLFGVSPANINLRKPSPPGRPLSARARADWSQLLLPWQ